MSPSPNWRPWCSAWWDEGEIVFDVSKLDGTPRKLLDALRPRQPRLGARIGQENGLRETYRWYQENANTLRLRACGEGRPTCEAA
jgi:hypothetical protein